MATQLRRLALTTLLLLVMVHLMPGRCNRRWTSADSRSEWGVM